MKIAISGASGKTGFRIAEESLKDKKDTRLLIRDTSVLPDSLKECEAFRISLNDPISLDKALEGCEALIISTGARPSIDLTGPARIDAFGVKNQVESCLRVGVKRIILVSSLCTGQLFHPLNLFGLILVWKRFGEQAVENSGLDWTVIRPGGLNEREEGLSEEGIVYTAANQQKDAYIPRRLLAKCCVEALNTTSSINKIIEVTSRTDIKPISMEQALNSF